MHAPINDKVAKRHTCSKPASPLTGLRQPGGATGGEEGTEPWRERFRDECRSALGDVADLIRERRAADDYDLFVLLDRWRTYGLSRLLKAGRAARTAVSRAMHQYKS